MASDKEEGNGLLGIGTGRRRSIEILRFELFTKMYIWWDSRFCVEGWGDSPVTVGTKKSFMFISEMLSEWQGGTVSLLVYNTQLIYSSTFFR